YIQAEDGIRDRNVTGVQTCALPIYTSAGGFVDADHAGVGGWGEYGVAAYVTVELAGDPVPAGEVGRGDHPQQRVPQFLAGCGAGQPLGGVGLDGVLVRRACVGAVVDGALVGHGGRWHVDDGVSLLGDDEVVAVGDFTDLGGGDVPFRAALQHF